MSLNSRKKVCDIQQVGILAERAQGRRAIKLRKEEREMLLFREKVSKAVEMFLDFHQDRTYAEIARELGMSITALHNLTKSEDFNEIFNEYYAEMNDNPRIKASQQAIADMVPLAIRTLKEIILDPGAPASSRIKAIEMVMRYAGIEKAQPKESDKGELQNFLLGKGVNIEQVNVSLPPSLQRAEALLASVPHAVVEGVIMEQPEPDPEDEP